MRKTGLTPFVTWISVMTQYAIRDGFARADVVFDQFGTSIVGMAGLNAMATGRPLVADGRPETFGPVTGERSPISQARTRRRSPDNSSVFSTPWNARSLDLSLELT